MDRKRGAGTFLTAAYSWICGSAAFIWLLTLSDVSELRNNGYLALFLVILRILVGQSDLTSLIIKDSILSRGSAARYINWSAAIIFGPIALWLDFIALIAAEIIVFLQRPRGASFTFAHRWRMLGQLPVIFSRDTLPALIALLIFSDASGNLIANQMPLFFTDVALYATLAKVGLSMLFLFPLFVLDLAFINPISGMLTGFIVALRSIRFILGGLLVVGIPDLLGLISATSFVPGDTWNYLLILFALTIALLFIHHLNRIGVNNRQEFEVKEILERFSRQLLVGSPDDQELTHLLEEYHPSLFPGCWLEVFLDPDTILYSSSANQRLLTQESVKRLEESDRSFIRYQLPAANSYLTALLVPIVSSDDYRFQGAIALAPRATCADLLDFLPALSSLSAVLAAAFRRNELLEEAFASQAEAFHDAMFAQAFEAEMTLSYQRMTQELALAGQIQNSFLPDSVPDLPGWQISVTLEPARETSGDYYDFIDLPGGFVGILVADVTDKGIGASLYMALSRTLIRTFALEFYRDPAEVLRASNRRILRDSNSDLFVTVFYGVLDIESGQMTYCNAGHNPPLHWRTGGSESPTALTRTSLPLGILEGEDWGQGIIQLLPGDVLALYTDGVTEAQDEDESFFGEERLQEVVLKNLEKAAPIIEDKVLTSLANFTGDAPQSDDYTLMIIKRE